MNKVVDKMKYEEAFDELQEIVAKLEAKPGGSGNLALEEALVLYARGESLTKRCDDLLKSAEARIEKLRRDSDDDSD